MSKASRGGARLAAGKKKAKRRIEPQPIAQMPQQTAAQETAQPEAASSRPSSGGAALQFRPRAREAAVARPVAGRGAKAILDAVDYGYVYTDLKIIGGLTTVIFGGLVVLSLMIR
ncbi:MAG: hypothetical protein ACYC66_09900 [Chloroflexota bacterium]